MKPMCIIIVSAFFVGVFAQTYVTSFDTAENPISEHGRWINGRDASELWTNVKTVGGVAKGCGNYPNWWLDATALLAGTWGPNQTVEAKVWYRGGSDDGNLETEIRLRSSLSSRRCDGYEILFNVSADGSGEGYMYIVRWNGPERDYTILKETEGLSYGVKNGDVVKGTIIGNVITAYINGIKKMQVTDNVHTNGQPGIGFDENTPDGEEFIGFSDFSVVATSGATVVKSHHTGRWPSNASLVVSSCRRAIVISSPVPVRGMICGPDGTFLMTFETDRENKCTLPLSRTGVYLVKTDVDAATRTVVVK